MKSTSRILGAVLVTAWLTGCATIPPSLTPVAQIALATSRYREALDVDRQVVTQFSPGEPIAISVYIPRGGGYGARDGTLTVRNAATGNVIRHETRQMTEEDYYSFRQDNPGPGTYNVEFSADNGVLATTHFEVR